MNRNYQEITPRVIACCGGMVIFGGQERMVFLVLKVLHERGAKVHCIVNDWENHRIVEVAERIGASWSTGYYRHRFNRRSRNPFKLIALLIGILRTTGELLRESWKFHPTHIFMPEFVSVLRNAPALFILRMLGVKVIMRLGDAPALGDFYRRIWKYGVDPFIDYYSCCSQFVEHELIAHGISPEKVRHIYNTLHPYNEDTPFLKNAHHDPNKIVFAGQIVPQKGLHLLLDAVGLLVSRGYKDLKLDVIGQMEGWISPSYAGYRERLLEKANQPDLAGRVQFLGWRNDVQDIFARAGIHCCPSLPEIREAFGLVNIEAKAVGIPSVVFPTGALPELIKHKENGWICSNASAESLAEGLEYYLADTRRREDAGRAAYRSLQQFRGMQFADAYWAVFQTNGARKARNKRSSITRLTQP